MKIDGQLLSDDFSEIEEYIENLEAEIDPAILDNMETANLQAILDMIEVDVPLEEEEPVIEVPVVELPAVELPVVEVAAALDEPVQQSFFPAEEVSSEVEIPTEIPVKKQINKKSLWIIIGAVVLAAIVAVAAWYFLMVDNIAKVLTLEAGSIVTAEDFKMISNDQEATFVTDMSSYDLSIPGNYPVQIGYYGRTYDSVLNVIDSVQPVLKTKDLILFSTEDPQPEDFIQEAYDESVMFYAFSNAPDMTAEGEQDIRILAIDLGGNITAADAKVTVVFDDVAPHLEGVADIQQYLGWEIDFMENVTATDNLDTSIDIEVDTSEVNMKKAGEYTVRYIATDTSGNKTAEMAKVTIVEDVAGPQILGVNKKLSMYQGRTMSYRSGVIVEDDYAENPTLTIDSTQADLTVPGQYTIIYKATDDVGNETVVETTLTVKQQPSSYVEDSVVYEKADEILAKILKDGMTQKEQIEAIAKWFKSNCSYVSYSDKTDRMQAAYRMMTRKYGDCFNYYAAFSVMMERLDIPQIHVERSRNSVRRTRHYWSMVSLDGGETYYHVDVSPHYSFSIKTVLVTDATLKKCNRYLAGYYTMDPGLYPATPENPPE